MENYIERILNAKGMPSRVIALGHGQLIKKPRTDKADFSPDNPEREQNALRVLATARELKDDKRIIQVNEMVGTGSFRLSHVLPEEEIARHHGGIDLPIVMPPKKWAMLFHASGVFEEGSNDPYEDPFPQDWIQIVDGDRPICYAPMEGELGPDTIVAEHPMKGEVQ